VSSTVIQLNTLRDFEVIWLDNLTGLPKDMLNVSMEIYHYEGPNSPRLVMPLSEPYIFTEGINDEVNIASIKTSTNTYIDPHINLELNLIVTDLQNLGCVPNDFVVPFTCNKVSIVNGYKKYALSACELSSLINLQATGYTTYAENGFLVIESDFEGMDSRLQVGNGTWNTTVGIVEGAQYFGSGIEKHIDFFQPNMNRVDVGTYVETNVSISGPTFDVGERYYVIYKGIDPLTNNPEIKKEDFTIERLKDGTLTASFLK